jgi:hypothetical protein
MILGDIIVQAKPSSGLPAAPSGVEVFRPGVVVHDHRGLRGRDLEAYNAILARAQKSKADIRAGKKPFAKIRNKLDGKIWGKYYNESQRLLTIKPVPPPDDPWWKDVANFIEDVGEAIVDGFDWVSAKFCKTLLESETFRAALKYGTAAAITAAGTAVGLPIAGAAAGTAAASGVGALQGVCAEKYPGQFPAPPADTPAPPSTALNLINISKFNVGPLVRPDTPPPPPASRFPSGSVARFNVTKNVWVIYGPASMGAATTSSGVVPPPPPGMIKLGEEVDRPADVPPAGEERDAKWYDPVPVKVGLAVGGGLVIGAVAWKLKRRRAA